MGYGYKHDDDGDIHIVNGEWAKGDTTDEIVRVTLLQVKHDDKLNPNVGIGIRTALGGPQSAIDSSIIKEQLKQQGLNVRNVTTDSNGNINVGL
jgi:hypothetical protein